MTVQRVNNSRRGSLGAPSILSINAISQNLLIMGLLFTTLVFHKATSMPSKITARSTDGDDSFVFPRKENPWRTVGARHDEKTIKRETLIPSASARQGNDVDLAGSIVFPTEEADHIPNIFIPGPAPKCIGKTYCETTDYYPTRLVNNVIERHDDLKFLAIVDEVDSVVQRIGDDTTALCPAEERLIFPTAAQNRDNNWLFVLNQANYRQGVRIETCQNADSECAVIGGFVEGYKTLCKQKYIYRQLAAITSNGTAIRDMFKLPSSCCCHIKFEGPYSRIGINFKSTTAQRTPVTKT